MGNVGLPGTLIAERDSLAIHFQHAIGWLQ